MQATNFDLRKTSGLSSTSLDFWLHQLPVSSIILKELLSRIWLNRNSKSTYISVITHFSVIFRTNSQNFESELLRQFCQCGLSVWSHVEADTSTHAPTAQGTNQRSPRSGEHRCFREVFSFELVYTKRIATVLVAGCVFQAYTLQVGFIRFDYCPLSRWKARNFGPCYFLALPFFDCLSQTWSWHFRYKIIVSIVEIAMLN